MFSYLALAERWEDCRINTRGVYPTGNPNPIHPLQLKPSQPLQIYGIKVPRRCSDSFTSIAFIKQEIQQARLREWQQTWQGTNKGSAYCNTARRRPLWGPAWKPTKLQNTSQTSSTIHQLRVGHGYFESFLTRLPNTTPHSANVLKRSRMSNTSSYGAHSTGTKDEGAESPDKPRCTTCCSHKGVRTSYETSFRQQE